METMSRLLHRSIKNQIRNLFIFSLLITMCIISVIIFYYWKISIDGAMQYAQEETAQAVLQGIKNFVDVPLKLNENNRYFLEKGLLDINNEKNAAKFFGGVMRSADENVYSFSFGATSGEYYGVRKNVDNQLEFMKSNRQTNGSSVYYLLDDNFELGNVTQRLGKFDPRTRDWYVAAEKERYPVFSDIYQHFVMKDLAISASYPIFDEDKKFMGVLGTHITLNKLNDELKDIVKNRRAEVYIFEEKSGKIVANTENVANFTIDKFGDFHRVGIENVNDGIIRNAYYIYENYKRNSTKEVKNGENFYIRMTEYRNHGIKWLIVIAVQENYYVTAIKKSIWISIALSTIILLISIYMSAKKIDQYLLPIYDLIGITKKFSAGNFKAKAETSQKNEIGILGAAFNNMAEHLAILINNLEQKVQERTNELEKKNQILSQTKEELEHSLQIDFLTGLYNRRFLIEKMEEIIKKCDEKSKTLSIIMMDIDFFKKINDKYGHDCGDFVLQEVAKCFQECIREYGYISRWGGEEFLILLPSFDKKRAFGIAEKLRHNIENHNFLCGEIAIKVTLTLGIAVYDGKMTLDSLIKFADIAVYKGKKNGRNQTQLYENDQ
ncbi:diguanylate cyclase [Pectinatus frisingensis]|uniref:sensor domain-containing diguanylate cyclase n=1 Tax=Pectinatus frisingensis TaxID=865 RepID=UPI0018C79BAA|nr:diguanylate cyclase [Pectinatus frisingensis]